MESSDLFTTDELMDDWVSHHNRVVSRNDGNNFETQTNDLPVGVGYDFDDGTEDNNIIDCGIEEEPVNCDDELHSLVGSDDEGNTRFVEYNEKTGANAPNLKAGMTFSTHKVYRDALKEWSIQNGYDYKYVHNDKKRITVKCKSSETCNFYVHASKIAEDGTMQIKTFKPTHQCSKEATNHLVNSKYLCDKYIDDLRDNLDMPNDALVKKATRELSSQVSRFQAYRAKKKAERIVQGDYKDQFKFVRDLCNVILSTNEGSTACVKVEVVPPMMIDGVRQEMKHRFERMYVCFNAFKVGFLTGCRPFIGLDGCHLKGPMGGHILAAISLDGNENMYPIALAVVEAETKDSWAWFIDLLHRDIGHTRDKNWTWISDQQKGLVEVFAEEMPYADHRSCLRHLYDNFKKQFKGKEYKDAFWAAANANTIKEWEGKMKKIQKMEDGKAFGWLMKLNPMTWTRSHMSSHSKCDLLVNNVCESFNEYIKDARDKPIISMWNWIRKSLMKRIVAKEEAMKNYLGPVCPNKQKKLEEIKECSRKYSAIEAGNKKYEVEGPGPNRIVDLGARSCSCREWDLNGIPCKHAVTCIWKNREKPEDYVDSFYSKSKYLETYRVKMVPIPGMDEWESVGLNPVDAPIIRRPPGRPKKARKKAIDEPKNPYKVSRRNKRGKCGNCNQEGHNVRKCKAGVTGETSWQRRMRKQAEKLASNCEQVQGTAPSPGRDIASSQIENIHSKRKGGDASSQPTTSKTKKRKNCGTHVET